jgi:hypothetical protein
MNHAALNSPNLRALDRLAQRLLPDIWAEGMALPLAELNPKAALATPLAASAPDFDRIDPPLKAE